MLLFHYTSRAAAIEILRSGVLRAFPVVAQDFRQPVTTQLAPAVWLTRRPQPSPMVLARMLLDGLAPEQDGACWRFLIDGRKYPLPSLGSWILGNGYAPRLFVWLMTAASFVGDDFNDWHLSPEDIPLGQLAGVQSFRAGEWRFSYPSGFFSARRMEVSR